MPSKISVIVTCFNHEEYVEQCLRSIFEQTYKDIDLLVINDGSTDNSNEIITRVLKDSTFPFTEYINQKNAGFCVTRNNGFEWALGRDGEFLLFVDSDDYLDKDYIEEIIKIAVSKNADIVYTNLVNAQTGEFVVKAIDYSFDILLRGNFINNSSLVRVSKIGKSRFDVNMRKWADYDFFLSLIINNGACPHPSSAKLRYRVLKNSISRKNNRESFEENYTIYLYIMNKYINKCTEKVIMAMSYNLLASGHKQDYLIDLVEKANAHVHRLKQYLASYKEDVKHLQNEKECLRLRIQDLENQIKNRNGNANFQGKKE